MQTPITQAVMVCCQICYST